MKKDNLSQSLDNLIDSLKGNVAAGTYYEKVKTRLLAITDEAELKAFLEALCGSAKIKDAHGFTLEQSQAWDKMWEQADSLKSTL